MSDYVHGDHRSRIAIEHRTIESRLLYGACYLSFLARAVVKRMVPWRWPPTYGDTGRRDSIFTEARTAAGVIVSSSFMGM